jgi:two-component system, NtrC family, sensor histidine kinase HydH
MDTPKKHRLSMGRRHSLLFRVAALSGILVLCLLGSVIVITQFYFHEVGRDLEKRTQAMVDDIRLELETGPDIPLSEVEEEFAAIHDDFDIALEAYSGEFLGGSHDREVLEDGTIRRTARVLVRYGNEQALFTARITVTPYSEVLQAFQNKYMLALTAVFCVALSLLIYFIVKALRPLRELSVSCAAISEGELRTVSTQGATGEVLALEETFNDMVDALREKEMVEAKLRQAQRLTALGNLSAGIAHDVRNPLNAIKLLSSHALDTLPDGPESPTAKPLQTIRDEVGRLEEIVSNFLSLAKERALATEDHPIDELLNACALLLQKDAEERRVALTTDLRAGNRTLQLDPKQFTRAILNVLLNSLEACAPGNRVRLSSRLSDRACEIEIQDDGPGLPADIAERAFDPYYTTKAGGTGLGLSITRGIIEEHHGTIELYSIQDHGCQILIRLPLS